MRNFHCSLFTVVTAILFVACDPVDKGESAGEGSTSGQGTSTSGEPGTSTGDEPTTGATGTTGEEEETTTSGAATTGDVEEDGCAARCANQVACEGEPDPECVEGCRKAGEIYEFIGEACGALYEEYAQCLGAATCEELGHADACSETVDTMLEVCTLQPCVDVCAREIECGLRQEGTQQTCAFECSSAQGLIASDLGEVCADQSVKYLQCRTALSCEELEEGSGCEAEADAANEACGGE